MFSSQSPLTLNTMREASSASRGGVLSTLIDRVRPGEVQEKVGLRTREDDREGRPSLGGTGAHCCLAA